MMALRIENGICGSSDSGGSGFADDSDGGDDGGCDGNVMAVLPTVVVVVVATTVVMEMSHSPSRTPVITMTLHARD